MEKKIDAFIERLSAEQVRNLAENIYENEAQRENLRLYLKFLCKNKPIYMWVDEAPGYQGCGITGIPFTDEGEMKNNLGTSQNGYFFMDENNPKKNSAGIIWQAIRAKGGNQIPLLWNAYPYHLFEKSGKDSNRKPNAVELQVGKKYLEELIDILGIPQNCIYAIGRTAEKQLGYMKEAYIRYPSYDGKDDCINGIFAIP